jgi:hypothetical protein
MSARPFRRELDQADAPVVRILPFHKRFFLQPIDGDTDRSRSKPYFGTNRIDRQRSLVEQHFEDACGSGVHMPAIRSDYILLADHSLTNDIASTSTRSRGTSSIFFRCHTEDAFESLAKRRVRVVANRLCYLEQLPILFL